MKIWASVFPYVPADIETILRVFPDVRLPDMNPSLCFDLLIAHAKRTEMPKTFQLDVIRKLEYFKAQSLCDIDRRDSPVVLRANWQAFTGQVRGLKFLESYKADEHFWRIVKAFVYEVEPCSVIIPEPPKKQVLEEKCEKWKPFDFFNNLISKMESRVQFGEDEKYMILFGLYYLRAESEVSPPSKRDLQKMKQVWSRIQTKLERVGFMAEFRDEKTLKDTIKYFIDRRFD